MKYLFAVTILCLLPFAVGATGCRVIHRQAVVHQQVHHAANYVAAVVNPYVATTYLATPVPSYHVAYSAQDGLSKELFEELKKSHAVNLAQAYQLGQAGSVQGNLQPQALNQPGNVAPQKLQAATARQPAHVALAAKSCVECHGAAPKGSKFKMFSADGAFIEPDDAGAAEIIRRITLPRDDPEAMPKGKSALTDREIIQFSNSMISGDPKQSQKK